ncbi:flagellar biosynthetic protein FliR [Mangrovicoccus algicola]|uniref:Flagellar biosynthetic protein FliR n=1 Tax=Mangrovicoccus algicola TaxID=2771008 RepID=A0A8J6YYE1_9RHOB|nr:flagellar biosynthetic protein FliR [Mangrovicoccus algicola]MBE3640217.1 flagellar biosynthetic protein FliR [Mangrovicoccus algicola]
MTMTAAALSLLEGLPAAEAFLVLMRTGTAFFLLPALGARAVSPRIRLVLALAVTLLVAPLAAELGDAPPPGAAYLAACAREAVAGLAIGFLCRALFWAIEIAGAMASQAISLAQILGNQVEQPQPAIGQFLYYAAIALAMALDYHAQVVVAMVDSYQVMPLGIGISPAAALRLGSETFVRLFEIAFGLSGPFLVVAVLYNLCLGVVNKAMPQLMVAFVGAPAISWLGLALLMVAAPVMLSVWLEMLTGTPLIEGLR